jgi:hypothetical protein
LSAQRTALLLVLLAAISGAAVFTPGADAGRPVAAAAGPAHISQAAPAVAGVVYNDANTNGAREPGEAGLAGWTVFVDLHGSGILTADDPQAVTGADGSYSIAGVPAGSYLVLVVQRSGYSCTMLGGCLSQGTFPAAQTLTADFGEAAVSQPPPPPPPPPPAKVPPPALGKTFSAGVLSGVVLIELPPGAHTSAVTPITKGTGFVALTQPRSLPVGTILDTTHGTLQVTTAVNTTGLTQSGAFAGGIFKLLQNRQQRGLTQLNVVLGRSATACPTVGKARTAAAKKKKLLPKSILGLLRANAKGKFVTRGRYSSATVRGTTWDTIDRCDGTLTVVHRGTVVVRDLRHRRSVILTAGRSYLAAKSP